MKIFENISLQKKNTTKIDCVAKYFVEVKNNEEVKKAVIYAKKNNIKFLILGAGSNVILPEIYSGLVIYISNKEYKIKEKRDRVILTAQAGAFLPDISKDISYFSASGFEWAGGVPGTIGGATRGNAGAFGDFMSDYLKRIEVLDVETLNNISFLKEDCYFDYRESIFKKEKKYIITSVQMEFLKKKGVIERYKEYLDYRKKNHPTEPSSGSVFKNPKVADDFFEKHKDTRKFIHLGFVPVRYLIGECGLSGKIIGGAQISTKHANFIINISNATHSDIKELIKLIIESIKEKYDITVEPEVEVIDKN